MVPVATVNEVEGTLPEASVETILTSGFVHPTGACSMPATSTVGCEASLLHSSMAPAEDAVNPAPETVTLEPLLRPVSGETESEAAALASEARAIPPAPDSISTAAIPRTTRRRVPLSIDSPIPNRDTAGRIRTVTPPYGPIPPLRPRQKL
jgi:hypothetical protein